MQPYFILNLKPRHFLKDILFVWVFPPLAFLNIMWKMEGSSENENTLVQNERCEMFLNGVECEDEIMEEIQQNPSLKTKNIDSRKWCFK